jgi:hypothetical protein
MGEQCGRKESSERYGEIVSVKQISLEISRNRPVRELRLFGLFFGAPVDEVAGVEGDAEQVGGNEAELGGAEADDADYRAIDGGNDPALPELLAN